MINGGHVHSYVLCKFAEETVKMMHALVQTFCTYLRLMTALQGVATGNEGLKVNTTSSCFARHYHCSKLCSLFFFLSLPSSISF